MKTENVGLTEEEALELAIDELESTFMVTSMEEIGSMLGWNDWVCVYRLPNGQIEAGIYWDHQLQWLGTENLKLNLPGDEKNDLVVLFHWNIDELADENFEITRK